MSMDTLREDLAANLKVVAAMKPELTTSTELAKHLRQVFWPFVESLVEELGDVDNCVGDLLEGAEDILQPETGAVFAGIIVAGRALAGKLRELVPAGTDATLDQSLEGYLALTEQGEAILSEIVVQGAEGEDEDDDVDQDDAEGAE